MVTLEESSPRPSDTGGVTGSARTRSLLARSGANWRRITSFLLPLLVTLLALGLSLYRLNSQSLWFDELATLARAGWQGSWSDAIRGPLNTPGNAKPPLSFLISHLSLILGDQVFLLRLPSALFATLTIPVTYVLGKALFAGQILRPSRSRTRLGRVGLLGALLVAVAPLQVRYAQELRMYAMWVFLSTLSLYLFWRAIRSGAGFWWIAFTSVSLLGLYTHQFTLLGLGALALFGLWLLARPSTRAEYPFRAWHLLFSFAALVLAYTPMAPFLASGLSGSEGLGGEPAQNWDLASLVSAARLFSGGYDTGTIVCVGLFGAAVVGLLVRGRAVLLLTTLWIALPVCILIVSPFGHELWVRYFLCALPVYLLLVAYGLLVTGEWFASWSADRIRLPVVRAEDLGRVTLLVTTVPLAGILLATSAASTSLYYSETKQNWRDATRLLCSLVKPGEPVYVRHWYYRIGVLYYASQGVRDPCPLSADDVQVLPKDLATALPAGGNLGCWLIVPAAPRFLPGGTVEAQIQPGYHLLEPSLFPPESVPKEIAIISPLAFSGVALVQIVPNEPASIRFWSVDNELELGECTWLQWEVDHVREVYLQSEAVVGHDHRRVCPKTTSCYELEVVHQDATVTRHMVEIEVRGP